MRVVIAAVFLQLILYVSGEHTNGESLAIVGRCLILHNGSIAVNGLIPVNGSYLCKATSQDNPTQASVELHVIVLRRQPLRPTPFSEEGSLAGVCVILENGSISLHGVFLDGVGSYSCLTTSPNNMIQTVSLQVLGAEERLSVSIVPTFPLPNGTLVAYRGLNVSFNCSSSSAPPSRTLSWGHWGAGPSNATLASGRGAWLGLRIPDIQPGDQGEYWCESRSNLTSRRTNCSTKLLVYYAPAQHPDCMWELGPDPSEVQFNCTWPGAYPTPMLRWVEIHDGPDTQAKDHLYVSDQADSLVVSLNRTGLFNGQTLKCIAEHPTLQQEEHKSCLLNLKLPYPEGNPLVTALEKTNVTLICTEDISVPPADTTWRRGVEQVEIKPGSKYSVVGSGPELRLTIYNLSKEDEGIYFCRSENPLAVRELEVYLTVKASSTYTGAIIGLFIALLVVGTGVITAKLVYCSSDRICLGNGFGRMEEDRGDVISLVDSEEEVFEQTVPRLPPVTNGHHTTHAEIHPVPVGDGEDIDSTEMSAQQRENIVEIEDPLQLIKF
ncbi:V-set and immunoglobulin domain-containing protein 10 [Gadus chalcogrammus]|uniref:V-set and immunoglobulin domain-containing protein 10 n=1 Tax=Gadus chalcogrammus TaxID=1042646 RepID=UPI0024C2D1D6|nr:V-set and immunoglobulin domain-containing protein 10 [Gadus chalcogrammus]